jgi:hypothetical protein
MTVHDITLTLSRELTEDEIEALFEACDTDPGIETGPLGTIVELRLEAPAFQEAADRAIRQVTRVIPQGWMIRPAG